MQTCTFSNLSTTSRLLLWLVLFNSCRHVPSISHGFAFISVKRKKKCAFASSSNKSSRRRVPEKQKTRRAAFDGLTCAWQAKCHGSEKSFFFFFSFRRNLSGSGVQNTNERPTKSTTKQTQEHVKPQSKTRRQIHKPQSKRPSVIPWLPSRDPQRDF